MAGDEHAHGLFFELKLFVHLKVFHIRESWMLFAEHVTEQRDLVALSVLLLGKFVHVRQRDEKLISVRVQTVKGSCFNQIFYDGATHAVLVNSQNEIPETLKCSAALTRAENRLHGRFSDFGNTAETKTDRALRCCKIRIGFVNIRSHNFNAGSSDLADIFSHHFFFSSNLA